VVTMLEADDGIDNVGDDVGSGENSLVVVVVVVVTV